MQEPLQTMMAYGEQHLGSDGQEEEGEEPLPPEDDWFFDTEVGVC